MADYKVTQLSVFMENKAGRLTDITNTLAGADVNIRGFSVADMADYGIFRLIVDGPDKAKQALNDLGFTVKESDVICVSVEDKPGGLAKILNVFSQNGISVEYMYFIAETKIAFGVEDIDKAIEVLAREGVVMLTKEDISKL
jgi:hypothetical protein